MAVESAWELAEMVGFPQAHSDFLDPSGPSLPPYDCNQKGLFIATSCSSSSFEKVPNPKAKQNPNTTRKT